MKPQRVVPLALGLAAILSACTDLFGVKVDDWVEPPPSGTGASSEPGPGLDASTDGSETSGHPTSSSDPTSAPDASAPSTTAAPSTSATSFDGTESEPNTDGVTDTKALDSVSSDGTSSVTSDLGSDSTGPFVATTTEPSTTALPGDCGNGATEAGETCDDDNLDPYDGCSATCQVEPWSFEVNGALSPAFDLSVTDYTVRLPTFTGSFYFAAQSPAGANFAVDGTTLGAGRWSSTPMYWGERRSFEVDVMVGGDVIRTYHFDVTRPEPTELYFKASNTETMDTFGTSVALSGDGSTLAVGARREDGSKLSGGTVADSDNLAQDAGAVYVFRRDETGAWFQHAYVKPLSPGEGDLFGTSVALSADGNTLAVGAPGESGGGFGVSNDPEPVDTSPASGAAYIFVSGGDGWTQQAYFKSRNNQAGITFGDVVALSADGDTLAVAAPSESGSRGGIGDGKNTNKLCGMSGAVFVFVRGATSAWSQQAYIKASEPEEMAVFGSSLAVSADGDTLAVGAFWADHVLGTTDATDAGDAGTVVETVSNSGAAYVFARRDRTWTEEARLEPSNIGDNYNFGHSVALSGDGNTLAVAANKEDLNPPPPGESESPDTRWNGGAVYVYQRMDSTWTEDAYLTALNAGNSDEFGTSLALNAAGTLLAVGAYQENGSGVLVTDGSNADDASFESGAVYVFRREPGQAWNHAVYVKAVNTGESDYFGASVAFSGDGSTLAVGAYNEEGPGVGLNANPNEDGASLAGAVYVVQ